MKTKIFLTFLAFVLTGCGKPLYIFHDKEKINIQSKTKIDDQYCKYVIRAADKEGWLRDFQFTLPNNFGEVGYTVTITNGIQAWPNK